MNRFITTPNAKIILTGSTFHETDGRLRASLTYTIENDDRVIEITIPEVDLNIPIKPNGLDINVFYAPWGYIDDAYLIIDASRFGISEGNTIEASNVFYTEKVIEEKPRDMTLEEIEEKLGFKVKLVSEKEK